MRALGFSWVLLIFDWFKSDWAGAWLAVGFAAFYLLLAAFARAGMRLHGKRLCFRHCT
jgi:hypothetical protein